MAGRPWQQGPEEAAYIISTARKQRERDAFNSLKDSSPGNEAAIFRVSYPS